MNPALAILLLLLTMTNDTRVDAGLQSAIEKIDADLRAETGVTQRALGLIDLKTKRVAMIDGDRVEYAASVAKIGILYAWFKSHPTEAVPKRELGLMIKASSNEMAARFSEEIGLARIQDILNADGFYDAKGDGGIWVGKHYGITGERIPDPIGGNSHAVTVRQLLRFYGLLHRDELISPAASRAMREIFASPEIPHDDIKFVKGLQGRDRRILRKWGSWEDWLHDSAIIEGEGRAYILVGLTKHKNGDAYLEKLAQRVDDLLK